MGMQGVSLLKILSSTEMLGAAVVAGWDGLGRLVTSVAVVEAPVAMEWLQGGELVLTTGYYLHNDQVAFTGFIKNLVEIGAAGVAIPPRSFIGTIPAGVIGKADELMFPVISLPTNSTFWKVAQTLIMELAVNEPPRLDLERDILGILEDGLGIPALLNYLAARLEAIIILQDKHLATLMVAAHEWELYNGVIKKYRALLREKIAAAWKQAPGQSKMSFSWELAGRHWQELIFIIPRQEMEDSLLLSLIAPLEQSVAGVVYEELQTAIGFIAICYGKLAASVDNLKGRKRFAFRNVLTGDNPHRIGEFVSIAPAFDLPGRLLAVQGQGIPRSSQQYKRMLDIIETHCQAQDPQALVTDQEDTIVILFHNESQDRSALEALIKGLEAYLEPITKPAALYWGIGNSARTVMEYKLTLDQARRALLLAQRDGSTSRVKFYQDLGIYQLVKDSQTLEFYRQYTRQFLAPILALEPASRQDLLLSLVTFFNCGCSYADAARNLFIHENTLRYRLQKVEELLKVDLRDLEQRYLTFFAIKILMLDHSWL